MLLFNFTVVSYLQNPKRIGFQPRLNWITLHFQPNTPLKLNGTHPQLAGNKIAFGVSGCYRMLQYFFLSLHTTQSLVYN